MSSFAGGEDEIIARYFAPLAVRAAGSFNLTDDCAVISPTPGDDIVVTVDAIAEGVHFLSGTAPADIGWRALAVNVSDLASKGARPSGYVMAVSFPERPHTDWLEGFTQGLSEAQDAFGMVLLGGDTDRRPGPMSVTITAWGLVPAGCMVRRTSLRVGDSIIASGTIGDGALGLKLAENPSLAGTWGLTAEEAAYLRGRYARPRPRTGLRDALIRHASAAMDISDGLLVDLSKMCRGGGVGSSVHVAKTPLSAPVKKALAADKHLIEAILSGGDDYEILAAVSPENVADFLAVAARCGIPAVKIGDVTENIGVQLLACDGTPVVISNLGWDHFGRETD